MRRRIAACPRNYLLAVLSLFLVCSLLTVDAQTINVQYIHTSGSIVNSILHVNGTKLYDPSGEEVFLKGIQATWNERMKRQGSQSLASSPYESWFTEEDVRTLSESGGNCLELHIIKLEEIMPERNLIDESFFTNWLDTWVSWCTQHELYAIINIRGFARPESSLQSWGPCMPHWMWEGYGEPTTEEQQSQINFDFFNTDEPKQEENRQAFINAWTYIAERYRNNPYVIFGILNEPLCHCHNQLTTTLAQHLGETYSILITRVIDAIRATGARQVVFVDRPYVWNHVQPVHRPNIVWEDHIYVTENRNISEWKGKVDGYTERYITNFGKPFFAGEYGCYNPTKPGDWETILSEQVEYLNSKPVCGRQWHQWDALEGEYVDYVYDWFTAEDSEWIIQTVLSS